MKKGAAVLHVSKYSLTGLLKPLLIGLFFQGADHLTVTWKVDEGIYQHVDVREEGKENAFSLGRSLWIDSEVGTKMDLRFEIAVIVLIFALGMLGCY